jgi:hypothetical protein
MKMKYFYQEIFDLVASVDLCGEPKAMEFHLVTGLNFLSICITAK